MSIVLSIRERQGQQTSDELVVGTKGDLSCPCSLGDADLVDGTLTSLFELCGHFGTEWRLMSSADRKGGISVLPVRNATGREGRGQGAVPGGPRLGQRARPPLSGSLRDSEVNR